MKKIGGRKYLQSLEKKYEKTLLFLNFLGKVFSEKRIPANKSLSNLLATTKTELFFNESRLHGLLRAMMNHPNVDWRSALSRGQLLSKLWLIEELSKIDTFKKSEIAFITGGWIGILPFLLNSHNEINFNKIRNFDLDKDSVEVSEQVNVEEYINDWQFKASVIDMNSINYESTQYHTTNGRDSFYMMESADLIINTSCEHLESFKDWICKIPQGKKVILQSNDFFDCDQHISCYQSLDDFLLAADLSNVIYSGALELEKYKRWMLIGHK